MKKPSQVYICTKCGAESPKWRGQCPDCQEWNTFSESAVAPRNKAQGSGGRGFGGKGYSGALEVQPLTAAVIDPPRVHTKNHEFDRIVGGGVVPGSVILIGGEPGIGKSTLMLQLMAGLAHEGKVLYVSGEEGQNQIRGRAHRLNVMQDGILLSSSTDVAAIVSGMEQHTPLAVVVDSIQTMRYDDPSFGSSGGGMAGSVGQVRLSSQVLAEAAKRLGVILILIGHVTKEGAIAGPKVLEHLVDTVLYFEGANTGQYRMLRVVKNRFGPSGELGVYEMAPDGLQIVDNPSALFITSRESPVPGIAVFSSMEGTRPMLMEFQALLSPSPFGMPRRSVIGWDANRLAMVLAVLETRVGYRFGQSDVWLSVVGGIKTTEPAADLAAALAVISAVLGRPVPLGLACLGEVALSGELRAAGMEDARMKEAERMGCNHVLSSPVSRKIGGVTIDRHEELRTLSELDKWCRRHLLARVSTNVPPTSKRRNQDADSNDSPQYEA